MGDQNNHVIDTTKEEGLVDVFSEIYHRLGDCLESKEHDSDLMKRTRWRNPNLPRGVYEEHSLPTERIVSMTITDDNLSVEDDNGYSVQPVKTYNASTALSQDVAGLVDGGANGGLANPAEMRLICYADPPRYVNITGVGNLKIPKLKIGTFAAKVQLQDGRWVIMIFHEYGELPNGRTIHSKIQLTDGGCVIDDNPELLGGKQSITTKEGRDIPLDFEAGLPYIKMQYPEEDDFENLPCISMTRDVEWDPSRYDMDKSSQVPDFDSSEDVQSVHHNFNEFGEFLDIKYGESKRAVDDPYDDLRQVSMGYQRRVASTGEILPDPIDPIHCAHAVGYSSDLYSEIRNKAYLINNINCCVDYAETKLQPQEYEQHRKYFLNQPVNVVKHSWLATTRHYRYIPHTNRLMTYRSPYPALNVFRRHEIVFTDTVFSDVSAWGGIEAAQVFAGKMSRYISVHGCKTDADFAKCLEDEIRKRGAPDKLASDRAKAQISEKVKDILRTLFIDDWQSEPHFHHQNFVERMIQELKKFANWVLNWSDAPAAAWFAAFEYVTFIMNRTAKESLNWRTPVEALTGQTPDISMLLHFTFWEPVFIKNYKGSGKNFPSESTEIIVRFIGYAEDVGHSCTFKVFNEETQEILYRSSLRKVNPDTDVIGVPPYDPKYVDPDDDDIEEVVNTRQMDDESLRRTAMFSPDELLGRTFLMPHEADGTRDRATIIGYETQAESPFDDDDGREEAIAEYQRKLEEEPARIKFKVRRGSNQLEEYVEWHQMCEFIEEQIQHEDKSWNFRKIVGHKRNLKSREIPQILILWESGEITYEPITTIYDADPFLVAQYAQDAGLIEEWQKRCPRLKLRKHAKNAKKMFRRINQSKLKSFKDSPIYMFGVKVPRNHKQAVKFDQDNGNRLWQEAEEKEINQMFEYRVFDDRGHKSRAKAPPGYKQITLNMVYACKHDGRRKARIVAGGHLTDDPIESVYSGVVSLRGIRLVVFLSELNEMDVYQTDIGNAFLEAKTSEKVYVIAGAEFGPRADHLFVIVGSLYGLKTSAKRFHEVLSDVLREMGFSPCPAEPDIWMRPVNADGTPMTQDQIKAEDPAFTYEGVGRAIYGGHYEYVATYIDDLTIGSKNPQAIIDYLEEQANFLLKGTERIKYLLGCDYWRENDGTLCSAPKKYIEKMQDTYERLFGEPPIPRKSPMDANAHPELDTTEFCEEEEKMIYQSLIGAVQWVISLGRFDIAVHVMTLGSFRCAPRTGHLEAVKRLYGYLTQMDQGTIRYRTEMPDLSDMEFEEYDWSRTPYAGAKEEYPSNLPAARGKPVQQITYVDANLYHDMLSGKSVTAVLHMLNKTPIEWYSKKQSTVVTATFGSENVAARTAIEQMKTFKYTLLYLGVPIIDRAVMVGDNKSVVDCDTQPHSRLAKRHLMLSYHYAVRDAIASGNYAFCWIDGKKNPADILSKHWNRNEVWESLQTLLFWSGDTANIPKKLKSADG